MFTDINRTNRLKIGLHTHTTLSDGRKSPEDVAALYAAAGYDAVALTDHWIYGEAREINGFKIISGCEYNMDSKNTSDGITETFHIIGIGMTRDPEIPKEYASGNTLPICERVKTVVKKIRDAGGLAILGHPAWSLNTPEQIIAAGDFDATEIYNSVSEHGMSDRPYSGLIVDMLATAGVVMPLLATDDAHYYEGDECRGMIMVDADKADELGLVRAIREEHFYATQGPEVHLERTADDRVKLTCTPAVKIAFFSNLPWTAGRIIRGEKITDAEYEIKLSAGELFVRAEVTDQDGLVGWSNIIRV